MEHNAKIRRNDSNPSVMHFQLPLAAEHETPKRTKTEGDEVRSIATKMSSLEYTNINQIEDDLYTATKGVLSSLPLNTQPYNHVTKFFTLAESILLNRTIPSPTTESKQAGGHTLRSLTNGTTTATTATTTPQVPTVRPPLREFLYTMGPNGPLFTSIAARDINPLIAQKLPSALTLPTSTGGTFTASSATIIPLNVNSVPTPRKLADATRKPASFARKRGDFSEDTLGRIQATRWLDWGTHASFAPEWDDGGVGGGFGAEGISVDWAYKRSKRRARTQVQQEEMVVEPVEQVIDEKLLLEWTESTPSMVPEVQQEDEKEEEVEEPEMSVDETLTGLRDMIILLGQLQTLRVASGKLEIPESEKSLGTPNLTIHTYFPADNIVTTFQTLIVTYSIPPKQLLSHLPSNSYDLLTVTHPQYMGSLPARKIPQWQPPQQHHHQQQQHQSHHHQQQPQPQRPMYQQQQQPRPLPSLPQQRLLASGAAGGVGLAGANMQAYSRGQSLTPMPRPNTYTPQGQGFPGPGQQGMYNSAPPLGTYRGVGRPRKYDVRR